MFFLALFLFPVAVYCLILGMINRRPHPVLVSGSWDFFGVLLAASGLILFGGPAVLTLFYDKEVRDFLLGRMRSVNFEFGDLLAKWWILWALYYLIVVAGSAFLIWLRHEVTSIYNIVPAVFDEVFGQLLDRLGCEWTRLGNRVFIGFRGSVRHGQVKHLELFSPPGDPHITAAPPSPETVPPVARRTDQEAVIDIEPFSATRHVTLIWRSATDQVRPEIEAELSRVLGEVRSHDNPAAGWLMVIASTLFALIFLGMVLMIFLAIQAHRAGR